MAITMEKIYEELKKIERSRMLPAGVVISGGSASISGILELAKKSFRLPSQLGYADDFDGAELGNAFSLGAALGLVLMASDMNNQKSSASFKLPKMPRLTSNKKSSFHEDKIKRFFRSLLP